MRLLLDGALERRKGGRVDRRHDQRPIRQQQHFSEREKAALRYAGAFKNGEHAIDSDEIFAQLHKHFSDEEIIELGLFCAETDGVGKFVRSLNVISWEEACSLNPNLNAAAAQIAAE
jgi:hypothetical protein